MSTVVGDSVARRREIPTAIVPGNAVVRRGERVGARVVPAEAAGETRNVGAATAPASTTGMLRPSQSRRSRYRRTQKQGADGSHYISRGSFGHNSSPLFSACERL